MTTASFGSISPIACSSASGCTGVARAIARAFAASSSRSTAIALVARAARHALADGGDDVRQRALWIAEDGDRRRIILAQLPGIHVEVDQLDRGRHRIDVGRKRQGEEIATNREQHVVLLEHLAHIGREADHRAAEQRMRGGKRGGARHELRIDGRT
jgi:hypothetical protein